MAFFALVPLLFAIEKKTTSESFRLGLITGTVVNLVGTYWLIGTINKFGGFNIILSVFFHIAISIFWGLMIALFCFAVSRMRLFKRGALLSGLMAASVWVALEFFFPFLFPYSISNFLAEYTVLVQIYDLLGIYPLSFIIIIVNYTIFQIIGSLLTNKPFPSAALGVCVLLVLLTVSYGLYRPGQIEKAISEAPKIRVGIVQANFNIFDKKSVNEEFMTLRHSELSGLLNKPELIVWPETAVQSWVSSDSKYFISAVGIAVPPITGAYFLSGGLSYSIKGEKSQREVDQFNTAFLTDSKGKILGRYNKIKLLMFGEYIPFSSYFPSIKEVSPSTGDFIAGTELNTLNIEEKGVKIAPLICYEDIIPSFARQFVRKGANLLVNMTNDAWFGRSFQPYQHLKLSTARAVETRRYLIRATNTGMSAVIDPLGRIVEKSGIFEVSVIEQDVALLELETLYTKIGDVFPWTCTVLSAIFFVSLGLRRGVKKKGPTR